MNIDAQILSALRESGDRPISGSDLAERAGLNRQTLSAHIDQLRRLGYEIESAPHLGYRLLQVPDVLHAEDLLARLGSTKIVGRDIRVFQETTSTNDVVEKLARDGVKEGVAVFAETQTRGRGRLGRPWISPAGKGLWFSILLRPKLPLEAVTQITIASATALARAIRLQAELKPEIKWPNDILIQGKKVAGILTELKAELDAVKHLIVGIGVDVNLGPSDFPPDLRPRATSLKIARGHPVDRAALAARFLREFDLEYDRVASGQFEAVADEWEAQCTTLGREVTIQLGTRHVRGRAESLDSAGALLIRTPHGHLERISSGDVFCDDSPL